MQENQDQDLANNTAVDSARAQRTAERRDRQRRNVRYVMAGAVLVAAVVALLVFLLMRTTSDMGYAVPELRGLHQPPYEYIGEIEVAGEVILIPPTSGHHTPQQSPFGFLGDSIAPESVVHNMEHGAVVVWYRPGDATLEAQIESVVERFGPQCLVAGTYDAMSVPVAATAWGRVLPQAAYDEAELRQFIIKYRGQLGPEAGICEASHTS